MKKFVVSFVVGLGLFVGGTIVSADELTHVVQSGDTLSGLAVKYNTTIDQLLVLNQTIENQDLIYDGEELIVASDEKTAATEKNTSEAVATVQETAPEAAEVASSAVQSGIPAGGSGVLNPVDGVNYYNGVRETYYSQKVLPGGGLNIPGRYVAADGTIRDADGYIVVASDQQAKGSTGQSSLGAYKVYDTGVGHAGIDIYTNW